MLLGRTFDNTDLVHKVLRPLIEDWKPKVRVFKDGNAKHTRTLWHP